MAAFCFLCESEKKERKVNRFMNEEFELEGLIKLLTVIVAAWEIIDLNRHICFSNLTISS